MKQVQQAELSPKNTQNEHKLSVLKPQYIVVYWLYIIIPSVLSCHIGPLPQHQQSMSKEHQQHLHDHLLQLERQEQ
jgi:hypothetical protein